MAQFDIYRNQGAQRAHIPFVVCVQSAQFDRYRRRVVVPLVRRTAMPVAAALAGSRMNSVFTIEGMELVLHPLDTVSAALEQLGEVAGSLADQGQRIADAMDELLTRSWG